MTAIAPVNGGGDIALLLAIAARRDRAAFATLFGRFAPKVKAWFQKTGTPAAQAEDLTQETMLTVWRKAELFDPARAGASTWIFTIARNQRIDAARRAALRVFDGDDPSMTPPEPTAPDAAFDTVQREQLVREALCSLTPDQAAVVRLSFFEDRPHAEIEQVLGIPLGTVKSRLRLAMQRLRARLDMPSDALPGVGFVPAKPAGDKPAGEIRARAKRAGEKSAGEKPAGHNPLGEKH